MILCMQKLKELKKMLKKLVLFFVLQLQRTMTLRGIYHKHLNYNLLKYFGTNFQFTVLSSGFFVLALELVNFNPLYRVSDFLKIIK